ncbi:MAG TPA: di-heme oxidoredictase family protein [Terriglobales bacterium]|jgi:CxxC motif-containing protein (DUF1111 family)|nr:di-heme oxidoredictase family protein [Terriglobales bacterium]
MLRQAKSDHNQQGRGTREFFRILLLSAIIVLLPFTVIQVGAGGPANAVDPGVRRGPLGAGQPIAGLTRQEQTVWNNVNATFKQVNSVTGTGVIGLGPRFNSNSCVSCHSQPAPGGASPPSNPLFSVYQLNGAQNTMPFFENQSGAALDARFPFLSDLQTPDNGVHQLFTVTGRTDAGNCNISQPTFQPNNLAARNPLPIFGDGLVEFILDSDIVNNAATICKTSTLGICGTPSHSDNDGTINRLGWKAQDRSLQIAAGLSYNVELGVTNELFPNEVDETPGCNPNPLPESSTNFTSGIQPYLFSGDPERFAIFMRFLAPPTPGACPGGDGSSCTNGQAQFSAIGCAQCHKASFRTPTNTVKALTNRVANLFSDLVLHHMGSCLADNIVLGAAQGDMFRTPPLWGVGKRVYFLHDGRTTDIVQAVENHSCAANGQYQASEANKVIDNFNALSSKDQQDLINFLRSL